jgi:hypothetical protein
VGPADDAIAVLQTEGSPQGLRDSHDLRGLIHWICGMHSAGQPRRAHQAYAQGRGIASGSHSDRSPPKSTRIGFADVNLDAVLREPEKAPLEPAQEDAGV